MKEVLDVEEMEDTSHIQFRGAERSVPKTSHNDALVIIALLSNYEVGRVFIDSASSADILFGDTPLEEVNTSLYGFVGEVVHPRGMISLLLTLGTKSTRKTCILKFLMVDVPSAYNVNLGRPTLNAFQAVISTYHMKIKFPTHDGVGEVQRDHLQSRKYYIEVIRKGQKRSTNEVFKGVSPNKRGKDAELVKEIEEGRETPAKVQPAEKLLNIELVLGDPEKITRIGSQMEDTIWEEVIQCLCRNADIFAWTPQDLEGIDLNIITHHLNIDPSIKSVKQKKRYFRLEKDKIIQAEVDKLIAPGHIEEIQFPEWLSNVVLVPKPRGK
ncbi:UNVERIFIED_CONTAM: hypothetical protein Slati_4429500 [Sesamum latifolium]|uniref:Reverse transcriptase domain-containing protein n=1 Tax=Sesamum latifolium TaxID=2727402 RepID=A0AAW2SQE6_9LAMI